jgi:hypothetical protein
VITVEKFIAIDHLSMPTVFTISNYRSLRNLVIPVNRFNVITGANGIGSRVFYRAMRLPPDTAQGILSDEDSTFRLHICFRCATPARLDTGLNLSRQLSVRIGSCPKPLLPSLLESYG